MIIPPFLKQGDKVSIVSPAKIISKPEIEFAIKELEKRGLLVVLGEDVFSSWNRFAGTDKQRLNDIQKALDNPEIKAIFFARGGYGSVRIIDKIDFTKFQAQPKWLVGYSDITVFHQHVNFNFNIATCHATMPLNMVNKELNRKSTADLLKTLFGKKQKFVLPANTLNRTGITTGELIGGNLSVLCSLIGTNSFVNTKDKILFIEDLCEEVYHLDRMMYQLKKSGNLNNLKGLIVGGFTNMTDVSGWFTQDSLEIIKSHVHEFYYPVCFDFPAGHISLNLPLIFGSKMELNVSPIGVVVK